MSKTGAIHKCNDYNSSLQGASCSAAFVTCSYGENVPYQVTGYNPYDMRIKCAKPPLCYDFSSVETFLNTPEVQTAIGASKKWSNMMIPTTMMIPASDPK